MIENGIRDPSFFFHLLFFCSLIGTFSIDGVCNQLGFHIRSKHELIINSCQVRLTTEYRAVLSHRLLPLRTDFQCPNILYKRENFHKMSEQSESAVEMKSVFLRELHWPIKHSSRDLCQIRLFFELGPD